VGVGAVVLDGDRVLLVRRGQEPLKGEWSIPGGALELGETLEAGVRREVAEETGLQVQVLAQIEALDRIVVEQQAVRYHYVLVDFLCAVSGGRLQAATDAAEAVWVPREQLGAPSAYQLAAETAAVIERGFRMAEAMAEKKTPAVE
jgi:ADP-ribose pyrophosphatase YjhB (NUDIX family)